MATPTRTHVFIDNQTLPAPQLNAEFDNLLNALALTNTDIASGAAIAISKIATGLSGSLVGTTDSQVLTNKTLTKPTIQGSTQALTADSDGTTITFDCSASNIHTVTLGGNRTLAVSNVTVGQAFVIRLTQDGVGSRTVTWFSGIAWDNAVVPTLTLTASKTDEFGFLCLSSGVYSGFFIGTAK